MNESKWPSSGYDLMGLNSHVISSKLQKFGISENGHYFRHYPLTGLNALYISLVVPRAGIEPATPAFSVLCSTD